MNKPSLENIIKESIKVKQDLLNNSLVEIIDCFSLVLNAVKNSNTLFICGNGGSAADAQHFAAELIVRYKKNRASIPAIAFTTDTSVLTACANDFSYDQIFSRQLEGLGNKGDLIIGLTTSGNSMNIIKAFEIAKKKKIKTICLTGMNGGKINKINLNGKIFVPSDVTARVQETHELILHSWCELIDHELF